MTSRSRARSGSCLRPAPGRWRAWSVVTAVWLLAYCADVSSAASQVVREIVIENLGSGTVDRGFVTAHIAINEGNKFDVNDVSRDIRTLIDTRRFSSVDVHAEEIEDGLRLIYSLRNRLQLTTPLTIEGAEHFRESKIRNWMNLDVGDFVDEQTLAVSAQKVVREYREDHYPETRVTWAIVEADKKQGLAEVHVHVAEGKRSRVKKFLFSGNRNIPARRLNKLLRQRAWWNPLAWFTGKKLNEEELRMARLDIRDYYVELGYLDAVVEKPAVSQLEDGKVLVTFSIDEGAAYAFGDLELTGVSEFPESALRENVSCLSGEPAKANAIRTTVDGIEDSYGEKGYVGTRVRPLLTPHRKEGTVDIDFAVTEGTLTTIRNIHIRGNTRTRDKVIRRELLVYPGEIYNTVKADQSERRIRNLGFFSSVRTYDESSLLPGERDLIVEVEEKRTGQLMLGAGFSSVDRLVGFVELGQGNFDLTGWPYFTGGGQKLRLRAQFGTTRKRYELSFTEPWFLDRRLSLGVDFYRSDYEYSDYDLKRTGAALNIGKALPGPNRVNFRYQIENVDLYNLADTNRYVFADDPDREYYFARESDTTESSFKITLSHDTRNNPFFPTRGNRAQLFGRVSGGIFGFDTDVYRVGFRSWHYVPVWYGHVLSLRTRYEVVEEYGDTEEMPITSRLFLGGGRTLRGFDYRDVGPKVIRQIAATDGGTITYDRPYGGRSLAMASLEYTIPLISRIRLAGFYDTGNAWIDAFELEVDDLASSYGVGLRLDMPGFPIRIDRAWVIENDDQYTDRDPWVVWIGYDF